MKEYRILWCQCPTNRNPWRVLFVEAATPDDARAIAKNHIERKYGIGWIKIDKITEAPVVPAGRVLEDSE